MEVTAGKHERKAFRRNHEPQDSPLMKIIGEIGRLKAIEQELRSQAQLEANFNDRQKENTKLRQRVETLEKKLAARDVQVSNLEKRIVELVQEADERDQVQLKADDSFAQAMDELIEKQRQLELKDREVHDRNKAIELKEKQLQMQAGTQHEREKELQNLVWTRDQQLWELKQMQEGQQEYFLHQMRNLQEELQSYKEQVNASAKQMNKWNSDIPLLTEDMLVSVIKQILPSNRQAARALTEEDKAKLDPFLTPHTWNMHYAPMYGTIESFLRNHPEVFGFTDSGGVYREDTMEGLQQSMSNGHGNGHGNGNGHSVEHREFPVSALTTLPNPSGNNPDKGNKAEILKKQVKFAKGAKSNPKKNKKTNNANKQKK